VESAEGSRQVEEKKGAGEDMEKELEEFLEARDLGKPVG